MAFFLHFRRNGAEWRRQFSMFLLLSPLALAGEESKACRSLDPAVKKKKHKSDQFQSEEQNRQSCAILFYFILFFLCFRFDPLFYRDNCCKYSWRTWREHLQSEKQLSRRADSDSLVPNPLFFNPKSFWPFSRAEGTTWCGSQSSFSCTHILQEFCHPLEVTISVL